MVLLSGGLGGARLAPALAARLGPSRLTIVANVGDDLDWLGLRVCPDLDSILYALAGVWDGARGWGRRDETFAVRDGTLGPATRDVARRLGVVEPALVPASEERAETRLRLRDGRVLHFQEWYVRERADPEVAEVLFADAHAAAAALEALAAAEAVVLGPSNPVSSIGAILALQGMRDAVRRVRRRIAVCPVVARVAVDSPAIAHHARARARLLAAEGSSDAPAAIAWRYRGVVERFVLDPADAEDAPEVRALGIEPAIAPLLDPPALADGIARLLEA